MQSQKNNSAIYYKRKNRYAQMLLVWIGMLALTVISWLGRGIDLKVSRPIDCYYNVENYHYSDRTAVHLKNCDYSFRDDILIPGMPDTKKRDLSKKIIYSSSQIPQGICLAENYLLITSYSTKKDRRGVLLVLDWRTGEYLTTLGMNQKSHLGGIAYDGTNVWVCNSANRTLERISFDFIELMVRKNRHKVVDATDMVDEFRLQNSPSCVAYYAGRLWVATHTKIFSSKVVAYHIDSSGKKLKALSEYEIPSKVQGLVFDEKGSVYLSLSYGRRESSYLRKYHSIIELASAPERPEKEIEMPPCSEDIDQRDGKIYVLFESAGEKYYEGTDGLGISIAPLDHILEIK